MREAGSQKVESQEAGASSAATAPAILPPAATLAPALHPDVVRLGLVSFLTDLSSEMIFSVFAIFFTTVAGASTALLGVVEGLADMAASSLNQIAGWLSDSSGRRKPLVLAGYGFSTLAKTILLVSSTVTGLTAFRVIERLGKGFRGPPRDAWLAAVAGHERRGYAFGVHKALDKAGAVLGPLLAYALLSWLGNAAGTFRLLFWVALLPAVLSVMLLARVPEQAGVAHRRESMRASWQALSPGFKGYLLPAACFSLAYFSFSFLLLRAGTLGFAVKDIILLYALFNAVAVVTAPLAGRLGDRVGRPWMLALGYLTYCLLCTGFAFAASRWQVVVLFLAYGIFCGIDDAQSKAFIADLEPERRGSAMGLYNFVTGLIYLPASLLAGALWLVDPASAFLAAAGLSLLALMVFGHSRWRSGQAA